MKKLFTTIMCVLMIACFMPTMAFADGPQVAKPTDGIIAAPLVDKDSNIKTKLENVCKAYTVTPSDGGQTLNIEVTNLLAHVNGQGKEGKWVGFCLPLPKNEAQKLQYSFNGAAMKEIDATVDYTDSSNGEKKYVSFYWDCSKSTMTKFTYQFAGQAEAKTFNIVFTETSTFAPEGKITAATLGAWDFSNPAKPTVFPNEVLYTKYALDYQAATGIATITISDLRKHLNGEGNPGRWVGIKMAGGENKTNFALWLDDALYYQGKIENGANSESYYFDSEKFTGKNVKYAFYNDDEWTSVNKTIPVYTVKVVVKEEAGIYGGGAAVAPSLPTLPTTPTAPTTPTTPEQKPATAATKTEANTAITTAAAANKYDKAEQTEVDQIVKDAEAKIKEAKTEDEVNAIKKDAEAKLDKILTTEEKVTIASLGEVSKRDFGAKSKKITKKNGKKAVTLSWAAPEGVDVDGYEIFRSTKKNSGYGTEPYFETTKTSYTNSKGLKSGKTYYYKVRAFVEINGERHYTDYSTKASRKI